MKIAMRDLEIRGEGNILGTEQSGNVSAIGFYLYCKLLKRTIKSLQGKLPTTLIDTKLDHTFDARLPEDSDIISSYRKKFGTCVRAQV